MIDRKELVEKMLIAYHGCRPHPANKLDEAMGAALSVAVDELLQEPNDVERKVFYVAYEESNRLTIAEDREAGLEAVIANRRAQLERVKTAEERVLVGKDFNGWYVQKDGAVLQDRLKEGIAYAARLGLIAQLKGSA